MRQEEISLPYKSRLIAAGLNLRFGFGVSFPASMCLDAVGWLPAGSAVNYWGWSRGEYILREVDES